MSILKYGQTNHRQLADGVTGAGLEDHGEGNYRDVDRRVDVDSAVPGLREGGSAARQDSFGHRHR